MKISLRCPFKPVHMLGKWLAAGCCVWLYGLIVVPMALAGTGGSLPQAAALQPAVASSAAVPVEQQPLTIRKPIPPNIMLMLDDSGSMRWDVMPDWSDLPAPNWDHIHNNWNHFVEADEFPLLDSAINGVYYNPKITYTPPPQANGQLYPAAVFTAAHINGFDPNSPVVNISTYRGGDDTNTTAYEASSVEYSVSVAKVGATSYTPSRDCPDGSDGSGKYPGYCFYRNNPENFNGNYAHFFIFYDNNNNDFYTTRCADVSDVYDYNGGTGDDKCYPGISFFTYVTTNADGTYTQHYVGAEDGDCAAAGLSSAVCTDSKEARQNVANWFTYYHTRILMAKSGLMTAFNTLNPKYRFGFGSINGNNNGNWHTDCDPDKSGAIECLDHTDVNGRMLANVTPFGKALVPDPSDPSGVIDNTNSQRYYFWNWIKHESANRSTPLRKSLQAVGMYYSTQSPWASRNATTHDTEYLACRQSYVILTTDGFWNGKSPSVGNQDGTAGPTVTGPNGASFTYKNVQPFSDSHSNTLADVAMKYWKNDLMPDINNEVPTNNVDPAFWQHMVTFTMGLGFKPVGIQPNGTTVQQIFKWANGGAAIGDFSWPEPRSDSAYNIADLAHAAVNGHGGFYEANNPKSFIDGLENALARASARTGSGASLAANSTQLDSGTTIYQALYHTKVWTGSLLAYAIDQHTGAIANAPTWNAAAEMPAAASRNIYTYNPATDTYLAFKNSGSSAPALSTAELNALGKTTADQVSMIDYLRGNPSNEIANGGSYRNRTTVLGDIVDSQPVFVGAPDSTIFEGEKFSGSSSYSTFVTSNQDRTKLIYVAANDGMLHAFNAKTGKEVYAFLPAAVITHGGTNAAGNVIGVSELASPEYGTQAAPHQYFNDGQLTVADAYFGKKWHTVLVGTTGRGLAETIYALDITDPSDIKFLWEHSAHDSGTNSGYIGQMTGKPIVAQVANGTWAVLIANGYNSANGTAALLQINLATGNLTVHSAGTDTANGLASPAVWIGNRANGISTVAYAGDLKGHVWSFQLTQTVKNADGSKTIKPDNDSDGTLLFTTSDGSKAQPITAGMLVGKDPSTGYLWLFFGTGRYLAPGDLNDNQVQSWYGLIVKAPQNSSLVTNLETENRDALVPRHIIAQIPAHKETVTRNGKQVTITIQPTRVISPAGSSNIESIADSGASGWYINLETPTTNGEGAVTGHVAEGERMTANNVFDGNTLIGTTQVPKSNDICNPSGTGWVMAISPFTGTNPQNPFFGINGDGLIDKSDLVKVGDKTYAAAGVGFNSLPNAPIFIGAGKLGDSSGVGHYYISLSNGSMGSGSGGAQGGNFQRVSWHEIVGD